MAVTSTTVADQIVIGGATLRLGDLVFTEVKRFHIETYRDTRRQHFRATEARLAKMAKRGCGRTPERPR